MGIIEILSLYLMVWCEGKKLKHGLLPSIDGLFWFIEKILIQYNHRRTKVVKRYYRKGKKNEGKKDI